MIQEIIHIQNTHSHLSMDARSLIDRDIKSLQAMTQSALTAYLYGAQMVVQAERNHPEERGQPTIQTFFQPQTRKKPHESQQHSSNDTNETN
jgi:sugar phosphate permease